MQQKTVAKIILKYQVPDCVLLNIKIILNNCNNCCSISSKIKSFLLVSLAAIVLSGCSMDASIQSLSQDIEKILFQKSTSTEVTPSSSQGVYTTKGYEVQSSVSYYNAKPEAVTNKGYTVQTNIQSTLFKER